MPDSRQVIDTIVSQHAEEASFLWEWRRGAVRAPHITMHEVARVDDRIAAHIDGLRIAGEPGWNACKALLANGEPGGMFAAMVLALEAKRREQIAMLFSLTEAVPAMQTGVTSAFGWVSAQFLQGTVKALLGASPPSRRRMGVACCAMHRVDPGESLDFAIEDADPALRFRALGAAAELGRLASLPGCHAHLRDPDPACRHRAAQSAVLLGDRGDAVNALQTLALSPGPFRDRALRMVLKVIAMQGGHAILKTLARDSANRRLLIEGAGIFGDPYYVPWLITQMADLKLARLAGESFTFITGLELAAHGLERKPTDDFESGPNDNPEDPDVAMDPDDGLPWPDGQKIRAWWDARKPGFAEGERYFMGEPVNLPHCRIVLREGFQRQRIAAAEYLCLLQPGTPLFPTAAPAWRQLRLLKKME